MNNKLNNEIMQKIEDLTRYYAEEQLDLLEEFSRIDCGTGDEEGNKKVVDIVNRVLESIPNLEISNPYSAGYGYHVVARIKPENSIGKIILNCHLDTVFHKGDAEKHPFHIEGEFAYGLGIADCKGGFVTSVYALKIAQECGVLPNKEIVLIYNCDEEVGSPTGRKIFKEESEGAEMAFVFEPAREENGVLTFRKGIAGVTIEVTGKEAHAGLKYTEGSSATLELAHQIVLLDSMNDPETGMYYNVGPLMGNKDTGVVAGYAKAEAIVALPSNESYNKVLDDCKLLEETIHVKGCTIKTATNKIFPTMEHTEGNVAVYKLVSQAGQLIGQSLPEQFSSGSSDACYFSSYGVPTVCGLGPYMNDIHTTKERLKVSTIKEKTHLFSIVLGIM